MEFLGDLQREFFDGLYTYRIQVAAGSMVVAVMGLAIAWWRAGSGLPGDIRPGRASSWRSYWSSVCR